MSYPLFVGASLSNSSQEVGMGKLRLYDTANGAFGSLLINDSAVQFRDTAGNLIAIGGGSGDMLLGTSQTVTGAKTFNNATLLLRNVANTFSAQFTNTNTAARTYTLPDAAGTIALTSDITGTNSGTNTGDQTITLTGAVTGSGTGTFAASLGSFTKSQLDSAVSDGNVLYVGDAPTGSTGSIDNRILRADGTGGAWLQNSPVTIDDSGNVTGVVGLTATGTITSSAANSVVASTSNSSSGAASFSATNNANVVCQFGVWGSTRSAFGGIDPSNAFIYGDNPFVITSLTSIKFCTGTGIPERLRLHSTGGLSYGSTTDPGAGVVAITGNLTATGTVRIGGGTAIAKVLSATATLDFPSIASNDTHTFTMTVTGAVAGNSVFVGVPSALDANLIWCASVTAADTVTIRVHNSSGASIDPASGTYRATVFQF